MQLQEAQSTAAKLETELGRAKLRQQEAQDETTGLAQTVDTMSTELEALRLALSTVGIGIHPGEALGKLLTTLRTEVAEARQRQRRQPTAHIRGDGAGAGQSSKTQSRFGPDTMEANGAGASSQGGGSANPEQNSLRQDFYTSNSLQSFEDLVHNIMSVQSLDAGLTRQIFEGRDVGATPPVQIYMDSGGQSSNSTDNKMAIVNHSFLISCLRLVGSVRAAWARQSHAEVRVKWCYKSHFFCFL